MMKILITGNSMSYLSGQPLYCYELARELKRQGHWVEVRSEWKNPHGKDGHRLRKNLEKENILCANWDDPKNADYELWLASEKISLKVLHVAEGVPMINIVHSEYPVEDPIEDIPMAWVCIRPSILEHIVSEHDIPREKCHVIYNGVDRERFCKIKKPKRDFTLAVVPCTLDTLREKFINHMIELADEKMHVHFYGFYCGAKMPISEEKEKFVKVFPDTFDIEKAIQNADEVAGILLGRVNLEANSCGVPSTIFDPVTLRSEKFLLPEAEFDKKHNIKNVARDIMKLAESINTEDITVIIPHHDKRDLLKDTIEDLSKIKNVMVVKGGTFAENCNRGGFAAGTKYVLFLNDDVRIKSADKLLSSMKQAMEDFDIVGCRIKKGLNGFVNDRGFLKPVDNNFDSVDYPSGCCLMMESKTFKELNGFDEAYVNGCEDTDLYMRAEKIKKKIGVVGESIEHLEGQSSNRYDHIDQNVVLYNSKWGNIAKVVHISKKPQKKIVDDWEML